MTHIILSIDKTTVIQAEIVGMAVLVYNMILQGALTVKKTSLGAKRVNDWLVS